MGDEVLLRQADISLSWEFVQGILFYFIFLIFRERFSP